jgi:hypothetical protein
MSFLRKLFTNKEEPIKSYSDFWNWFQKHAKYFHKAVEKGDNIEQHFFNKLEPKLNELKEGFYFLTGMSNSNTAELVITADGNIKNIVFVEELVNTAPKIDGWKFTALKPALNVDDVNIGMAGYKFNQEKINFYSNDNPDYPDEIDITIVHKDLNNENRSEIVNGTYIFLDNYLGELNFINIIDKLTIIGSQEVEKEIIPINKLSDFLNWRQKEFIEKYEGKRTDTSNDTFSILEAELKNGRKLIAAINTSLLEWECKASHPWILSFEIKYNGENYNGLPEKETYELLTSYEDELKEVLTDKEGYLYIGRQSADNVREIYFACKEFRKPSKVAFEFQKKYENKEEINYDVYKDKYWMSFNRFIPKY